MFVCKAAFSSAIAGAFLVIFAFLILAAFSFGVIFVGESAFAAAVTRAFVEELAQLGAGG
jgi:hypothetical protein